MSDKKTNWLFGAAGITSALLYIGAWIIGDMLRPGFSMQTQAVSELIEAGAPNKARPCLFVSSVDKPISFPGDNNLSRSVITSFKVEVE